MTEDAALLLLEHMERCEAALERIEQELRELNASFDLLGDTQNQLSKQLDLDS